MSALEKRIAQLEDDLRAFWRQTSMLHRQWRAELNRYEDRMDERFDQVNLSIQALKDSIERQDFRHRELAARVTDLETRKPF